MGRGRPRKPDSELKRPRRQPKEPILPTNSDDSIQFGVESRDQVYQNYEATRQAELEDSGVVEEEVTEVAPEEETIQDTTPEEVVEEETAPVEAEADDSTEEEESTEYETETDDKKIIEKATSEEPVKTVPLGALHEEREKRKTLQREIDQIAEQNRVLLEDNKKFLQEQTSYEEPQDDYVRNLESRLKQLEESQKTSESVRAQREIEQQVDTVDTTLKSKGVYGFKELGQTIVQKRLNEMYVDDPDYALAHDNPEGWMKIYNEELPKIQNVFQAQNKKTTLQKAEDRKKDAQLITKSGKVAEEAPKKVLSEYEEYIQMRDKAKI